MLSSIKIRDLSIDSVLIPSAINSRIPKEFIDNGAKLALLSGFN